MSVLKKNKILRSVSGEILKEAPIVDISSDYGVTKDVSNIVSKVKNRYQPSNLLASTGSVIENGDGLEFGTGVNRMYSKGLACDFRQGFIFESWIKLTDDGTYQQIYHQNSDD